MRKLLLVVLAQVGWVFGASAAWVAVETIEDGGSFNLEASANSLPEKSGCVKNYVELLGNATIVFSKPATKPTPYDGYVNTTFINRSHQGTLTLDFSAFEATDSVRFTGTISCQKVIIKGITKFDYYGANFVAGNMATIDFAEMKFVDADGNPVDDVTVEFNYVQLMQMPAGVKVTFGANPIVLTAAGLLNHDWVEGGKYLAHKDFVIEAGQTFVALTNNTVLAEQKIVVEDGGTFQSLPYLMMFTTDVGFISWWGWTQPLTSATCHVIPNDIDLKGPNSKYIISNHYFSKTTGAITGTGQVVLSPNNSKMSNDTYKMVVASTFADFAGTITVQCITGAPQLVSSQLDLSRATVSIENSGVDPSALEIAPQDRAVAAPVPVKKLVSTGLTPNRLKVTGCQVEIQELDGALTIVDGGEASVQIDSLGVGDSVVAPDSVTVTFGEQVDPSGIITLSGPLCAYVNAGNSALVDFGSVTLDPSISYTLVPVAGRRYVNVPPNVRIGKTESGDAFEVVPGLSAPTDIRFRDGAVTIGEAVPDWQAKADVWFDFSSAGSVVSVADAFDDNSLTYSGHPLVKSVKDVRGSGYTTYSLVNNRFASSTESGFTSGVYTYLADFGDGDSRQVMYCVNPTGSPDGARRRIAFAQSGTAASMTFGTVVMVFGSQRGGGRALLANSSAAYVRNAAADAAWSDADTVRQYPLVADASKVDGVWVDGVAVDPTQGGLLDGGWQVITVNPKATVSGLGYAKTDHQDAGGQVYAEFVGFKNVLSDAERIAVERFLAEKWSIAEKYRGPVTPGRVRMFGDGTVTLAGGMTEIGGAFVGTVDLNGKRLILGAGAPPPTADDIPGVDRGRIAWLDPDYSDDVHGDYAHKYGSNVYLDPYLCDYVYDRDYYQVEGKATLRSTGNGRAPAIVPAAHGFGPVRKWLDYRNFYTELPEHADNQGNTMRFSTYPASGTTCNPIQARTVFLVSDSVFGGGTPFMGDVSGGSSGPGARINPKDAPDPRLPIWRAATAVNIFGSAKGGVTRLNGVEVPGESTGFTGGPEVLTAVGNATFNLGVFGNYQVLENVVGLTDNAEVQGEAIVYGDVLTAAEMATTEAYLMYKWMGTLPEGFDSHVGLTLTGAGTVELAGLTGLPVFGDGFEGTVVLPVGELVLTVGQEGYTGPFLDFGEGVMDLSRVTAITVDVAEGAPFGVYPIAACSSVEGLAVEPQISVPSSRRVQVRMDDEGLKLVIQPASGMIFLLK